MNPSDRAISTAKWYCTNGMIMTVLANVVKNQHVMLIVVICALLQFGMCAFEIAIARRYQRIEKVEREEARKRVKKLLKDLDDVTNEFEKKLNEAQKKTK